jgi:peptidoglycan/LPS O-acetylase OafA/YrhL
MADAVLERSRRLWTIDVLRGVAALGVVMFHASDVGGLSRAGLLATALDAVVTWGRYGVWLFFVISGFCIHLQWTGRATAGDLSFPSFTSFWKRRFRRLYPPYFVALVLFLALRWWSGIEMNPKQVRDAVLHFFLVQNLVPGGSYAINEVFWTLAIEEQLYLLYFVFLAIRIRFGWIAALAGALGTRLAWFVIAFVVHKAYGWDIVVTQMAFVQWIVWILGALAVEVRFGLVRLPRIFSSRILALVLLLVAARISFLYLYVLTDGTVRDLLWLATDVVWGAAFFVLVNAVVRLEADGPGAIGRLLARVGLFSYSLYLSHEVVTVYLWKALRPFGILPPSISGLVLIPLLTIVSLAFAWAFFQLFERPFLSRSREVLAVRASVA